MYDTYHCCGYLLHILFLHNRFTDKYEVSFIILSFLPLKTSTVSQKLVSQENKFSKRAKIRRLFFAKYRLKILFTRFF